MQVRTATPIEYKASVLESPVVADRSRFVSKGTRCRRDDVCKEFFQFDLPVSAADVRRPNGNDLQREGRTTCPPYAFTRLQKNWGLITSNCLNSAHKQVSRGRVLR